MEKAHEVVLRKNTVVIKKNLSPEDTVIDTLIVESIISDDQKVKLAQHKDNPKEQANLLLDFLPRAGSKAWGVFIQSLKDSETTVHHELAKTLLDALQEYERETGDGSAMSSWPVADPPSGGSTPTTWDTTSPDWPGHSSSAGHTMTVDLDDSNEVYPMERNPRGIAYIINNKNFARKSGMPKRNGTDVDARALDKLWTDLGFKTKTFTDIGGYNLRHELQNLARMDHTGYNCVIISILTHGVEGKLYASDGELVPVEELIALFNADVIHRSLVGKPRLFFLQACRGDYFDKGVDQVDSGALVTAMLGDDQTDSKLSSLPSQADMFIAYATIPGYVSWRNSERGAWFIQGIIKVFNKFSDREHLVDMMVRVNRYVATEFEASGHNKQIPSPIVQLTKKLFFRPGHYKK